MSAKLDSKEDILLMMYSHIFLFIFFLPLLITDGKKHATLYLGKKFWYLPLPWEEIKHYIITEVSHVHSRKIHKQ